MLLALYGTLRKDEYLHEYIDYYAQRYEHEMEVVNLDGIAIYILGDAPGAKLKENSSGVVELWEFTMDDRAEEELIQLLDQIEGVGSGMYNRSYINTPRGEAIIYTYRGRVRGLIKIKDWKEWVHSTTIVEKARALLEAVRYKNLK